MLGWEFPPFISGGLGTACHGLTRALTGQGASILFVLPRAEAGLDMPAASVGATRESRAETRVVFRAVPSQVTSPYPGTGAGWVGVCEGSCQESMLPASQRLMDGLRVVGTGGMGGYDGDMVGRIAEYAGRYEEITRGEEFDVIHAHDWVTFPAAIAIAARSGRPLVVHVHSTEFDRSGDRANRAVYEVERAGMHAAATIIAVSNLTKRIIVDRYDVLPEKVRVVHNGIEDDGAQRSSPGPRGADKVVLFLGRITMQKGPEYFVRTAARVLEKLDGVRFVVAGWGDLGPRSVEQVAAMGLGRHIRFTDFLRGQEVRRAYRMADVYVMPSVSEPFGLAVTLKWRIRRRSCRRTMKTYSTRNVIVATVKKSMAAIWPT